MRELEVASPRATARSAWGEPQILHPAAKSERPPYRYISVTDDHCLVKLRGRHVADARRSAEGGWELFAVERPALAIGWAGNLCAMKLLVPEALPVQAAAQPGQYGWCLLIFQKVEVYWRLLPAPLAEVA